MREGGICISPAFDDTLPYLRYPLIREPPYSIYNLSYQAFFFSANLETWLLN